MERFSSRKGSAFSQMMVLASTLEISRRLVADYRKAKPIPRHIALATRYLVEHAPASAG